MELFLESRRGKIMESLNDEEKICNREPKNHHKHAVLVCIPIISLTT